MTVKIPESVRDYLHDGGVRHAISELLPGRTIPIAEARRIGYDASKHAVVFMEETRGHRRTHSRDVQHRAP